MSRFYRVPYCVPAWGWAEHWAILRCLLAGKLIDGPDKEKLYQAIREKTGVPHVFGFGSGRDAIFAALKAWGVGPGDRVILPSYCCESVVLPVIECGAEPAFCDIGDDFNLDVKDALSLVDDRTKAIIVPHLFGRPARIDQVEERLTALGCRRRVLVIDDAAQSFGATLNGRMIGTYGDVGIVSFGAGKTMAASGGGLLLTASKPIATRVAHTPPRSADLRTKAVRVFHWVVFRRWRKYTLPLYPLFSSLVAQGKNAGREPRTLANVDALIARCQLRRLDGFLCVRRERRGVLERLFLSCASDLVPLSDGAEGVMRSDEACSKYVMRLAPTEGGEAAGLRLQKLWRRAGVEIWPLYEPAHHRMQNMAVNRILEKTEAYASRAVQIPMDPSISRREWERLLRGLQENLSMCGRHRGESGIGQNPSE